MAKIVIDPGHGGEDPGATGNGLKEKDLNFSLSKMVVDKLMIYEVDVILTRTADIELGLYDRCEIANNAGADYFFSIHTNAGGGTGFESYVYTGVEEYTENLRGIIHDRVAVYYKRAGFADRGKKRANFVVLRETEMPAVLLENLFIDSQKDVVKLKDVSFLDGLAGAIAEGLVTALDLPVRINKPEPTTPAPAPGWDPAAEIAKLKADGMIKNDHQPDDPVVWGELATVLNRLRNK